jgi:hypothetical protein
MHKRLEGNGESKVTILVHEKRPGYVIIAPDRIDKLPAQTPIHLSLTLENWQKENPGVRIRAVCPIVDDGHTLALHVWFDR